MNPEIQYLAAYVQMHGLDDDLKRCIQNALDLLEQSQEVNGKLERKINQTRNENQLNVERLNQVIQENNKTLNWLQSSVNQYLFRIKEDENKIKMLERENQELRDQNRIGNDILNRVQEECEVERAKAKSLQDALEEAQVVISDLERVREENVELQQELLLAQQLESMTIDEHPPLERELSGLVARLNEQVPDLDLSLLEPSTSKPLPQPSTSRAHAKTKETKPNRKNGKSSKLKNLSKSGRSGKSSHRKDSEIN